MPTIDDLRGDKALLEEKMFALLNEFATKHDLYDIEVEVQSMSRLTATPSFNVEIIVKI